MGLAVTGFSPSQFDSDSLWTLDRLDQAVISGTSAIIFYLGGWIAFKTALLLTPEKAKTIAKVFLLVANIVGLNFIFISFWILSPQIIIVTIASYLRIFHHNGWFAQALVFRMFVKFYTDFRPIT